MGEKAGEVRPEEKQKAGLTTMRDEEELSKGLRSQEPQANVGKDTLLHL